MPRQTDLTIMYSGGLDSFISYHYALKQGFSPLCLFVDMGHPYAEKEWNAIMSIPEDIRPPVEKLKMTDLYTLISSRLHNQIIPSRNVMLATIGAMFSPRVWINALDGEQNGKEHDKSERYFEDTSKLLSFTNEAFQTETIIESPFANMSKAETIKWALDNGIPKEHLFATSSCYDDTFKKCGTCLTCYKRKTAFLLNGIDEPGYENNPLASEYSKEVSLEMEKAIKNNDFSRFTKKRVQEHFILQDLLKLSY